LLLVLLVVEVLGLVLLQWGDKRYLGAVVKLLLLLKLVLLLLLLEKLGIGHLVWIHVVVLVLLGCLGSTAVHADELELLGIADAGITGCRPGSMLDYTAILSDDNGVVAGDSDMADRLIRHGSRRGIPLWRIPSSRRNFREVKSTRKPREIWTTVRYI